MSLLEVSYFKKNGKELFVEKNKEYQKIKLDSKTLSEKDAEILNFFEEFIVGQSIAKKKMLHAFLHLNRRITGWRKPISTLLFVGPPGTGKTLSVKTFAGFLYGDQDAFIRINGADFERGLSTLTQYDLDKFGFEIQIEKKLGKKMDKICAREQSVEESIAITTEIISKSPDGKDKDEASNHLSNLKAEAKKIKEEKDLLSKKCPYVPGGYPSILLIEGVDEMHSIFQNSLRQILNQGLLTSHKETISLRNCFIFLTTNNLSEDLEKDLLGKGEIKLPGIGCDKKDPYNTLVGQTIKKTSIIIDLLKEIGKENFVVFKNFSHLEINQIIERQLEDISYQLAGDNVELNFTPELIDHIYGQSQDKLNKNFGAAPIERVIETKILKQLVVLLQKGKNGGIVQGDKLEITVEKMGNEEDVIINKLILLPEKTA